MYWNLLLAINTTTATPNNTITTTTSRNNNNNNNKLGYAVAQLVEALCYKPEGHGFDSP
jgi:hypothetical protein